ncbi:MAG: tetratricopeptide repeat protein [Salinivirgaceae bacterium]|nr:tetratricopeptide repeat protein [Salinivirgaceae bacterium]
MKTKQKNKILLVLFVCLSISFVLSFENCTNKKDVNEKKFIEKHTVKSNADNGLFFYENLAKTVDSLNIINVSIWYNNQLADNYLNDFSLNKVEEILNETNKLIENKEESEYTADFHRITGDFLNYSARYDSSITHYQKALEIAEKLKIENKILFEIYIGLANHWFYQNDFDESLIYIYI